MNHQAFLILPYVQLVKYGLRAFNVTLGFTTRYVLPQAFAVIMALSVIVHHLVKEIKTMSRPKFAKQTLAQKYAAKRFGQSKRPQYVKTLPSPSVPVSEIVESTVEELAIPQTVEPTYKALESMTLEELQLQAKELKIKGWNFFKQPEKLILKIKEVQTNG